MASPNLDKLYQNTSRSKTESKARQSSKKRRVTTRGNNSGQLTQSSKSKTKKGSRNHTSKGVATRKKEDNKTVFNSSQDKSLAVIDHYTNLGQTVNALYKFSNTMNLTDLNTALTSGLSGINKVTSYLKAANQIKDTLQKGSFIDIVGELAPGAKSALVAAGVKAEDVDKYIGAAKTAIAVGTTVRSVAKGDLPLMKGLSDVSKAVFGVEIGLIKDVNALVATGTALIKEFSKAGVALKEQWDKLFGNDRTYGQNGVFISNRVRFEMVNNVLVDLSTNGDYGTIMKAIDSLNPYTMESVGRGVVENMIRNFSRSAVFNKGRPAQDIMNDIMGVINRFQNGDYLWMKREGDERRHLNLALFANASDDLRQVLREALADDFYLTPGTNVNWAYNHANNHALLLFAANASLDRDFKEELHKHFPNFVINDTVKTKTHVEPSYYGIF